MNPVLWLEHWQAILTATVVGATLAALLLGRRAPDMAMIGAVVVLLAAGILVRPGDPRLARILFTLAGLLGLILVGGFFGLIGGG